MRGLFLLAGLLFMVAFAIHERTQLAREEAASRESDRRMDEETLLQPAWREGEIALATEVLEDKVSETGLVFFPRSRVVASVSDPEGEDGRQRVIETVETSMKDKFVRVERTLQSFAGGGSQVVEEVAMVANQLLLRKPTGMASYMFLDLLTQAGAFEVKELQGDSYLATFQARPENPRALDDYTARVQELAGVEVKMEPNYIGQLF